MSQKSIVILFLILTLSACQRVAYDRCDSRWAWRFYPDPLSCQTTPGRTLFDWNIEIVTLLANFHAWNHLPCLDVNPCTPGVLSQPFLPKDPIKLVPELGTIYLEDGTTNIPLMKKAIQNGSGVVIFTTTLTNVLAYELAQEGFSVVDSRGTQSLLLDKDVRSGKIVNIVHH